eukprot:scaffold1457_cov185-Amphora_coffeaeformis.AAC.8
MKRQQQLTDTATKETFVILRETTSKIASVQETPSKTKWFDVEIAEYSNHPRGNKGQEPKDLHVGGWIVFMKKTKTNPIQLSRMSGRVYRNHGKKLLIVLLSGTKDEIACVYPEDVVQYFKKRRN